MTIAVSNLLCMTPCLEVPGFHSTKGYGFRSLNGRQMRAHRAAWIEAHGPIPDGMMVLHRCDNPGCVRVEHLFLGTAADNTADMITKGRMPWSATHCPHGHEYTPGNTKVNKRGARECRACRCESSRRYRHGE